VIADSTPDGPPLHRKAPLQNADRTPAQTEPETPLALLRLYLDKGNLKERYRANLKPTPKTAELDRAFARHVLPGAQLRVRA
jgi:hypothetical protein